jgi:hypothetical protein
MASRLGAVRILSALLRVHLRAERSYQRPGTKELVGLYTFGNWALVEGAKDARTRLAERQHDTYMVCVFTSSCI